MCSYSYIQTYVGMRMSMYFVKFPFLMEFWEYRVGSSVGLPLSIETILCTGGVYDDTILPGHLGITVLRQNAALLKLTPQRRRPEKKEFY